MAEIADAFSSPIGDLFSIAAGAVYPKPWVVTNPYNNRYTLAGKSSIHTGDDLVRTDGKTPHQPIYSVANGTVIYSRRVWLSNGQPSTWGNLIVIRHDMVDGSKAYSRYGHSENVRVSEGQDVKRGDHISDVGNAFGLMPWHLHFDLSTDDALEKSPADWPWLDESRILRDYVDPHKFLKEHVGPMGSLGIDQFKQAVATLEPTTALFFSAKFEASQPDPNAATYPFNVEYSFSVADFVAAFQEKPPAPTNQGVTTSPGVNLRAAPSTSAAILVHGLLSGAAFTVIQAHAKIADGYDWSQVKLVNGTVGFLATKYTNIA